MAVIEVPETFFVQIRKAVWSEIHQSVGRTTDLMRAVDPDAGYVGEDLNDSVAFTHRMVDVWAQIPDEYPEGVTELQASEGDLMAVLETFYHDAAENLCRNADYSPPVFEMVRGEAEALDWAGGLIKALDAERVAV